MKTNIPANLDLDHVLKENPPRFGFKKEKFIYILNLLTTIPSYRKELLEESGFIPLMSYYLKNKIRNYREYINYLIEECIIETDNQYIPNEKAKGYRFTKQYQTKNKIIECPFLKPGKQSKDGWKKQLMAKRKYSWLTRSFNPSLEINGNGAAEFLEMTLDENIRNGKNNPYAKYNTGMYNVKRFQEHRYWYSVDKTAGRFHSNLTICNSGLRNFLTYEGQSLVCLDIKNSQPFFSTILFNPCFWEDSSTSYPSFNIYSLSNELKLSSGIIKKVRDSIMCRNTSETLGNSVIDDISVFCQKTAEGTLYDYIEEETNIRTGAVTQSRDDFKKIVFKSLYSSNSFINQLEAAEKRIFNAIFPKVSYVYNLIKQVDHRTLAILLQRIESRFILDIVTKQISSTYPGIPVYTIHDSIAFPVGLEKNIEALVLAASREYLGIKMTLKMEYWRP